VHLAGVVFTLLLKEVGAEKMQVVCWARLAMNTSRLDRGASISSGVPEWTATPAVMAT
jgi:hypothetical protein